MKTRPSFPRTLLALLSFAAAIIALGGSMSSAQAQSTNAWWKPSALGGSGTWSSANAFWSTNSDGSGTLASPTTLGTNTIYNFSGTAGTVTESSSFTVFGINWLTSGYIWTSAANRTLTGTDQAATGVNTIYITNDANLTLTGSGFTFDALGMTGGAGATLTLSNAVGATTTNIWGTSIARSGRTNSVNTIIAGGGTIVYGTGGGGGFTQLGNITNNSAGMLVLTNSASGTVTVAGAISGSGAVTLVSSTNSARIALNASNSFSGGTTLNALSSITNAIRINDSSSFGTGAIASAGTGANSIRATVADLNLSNAVALTSGSTLLLGVTNTGYKLTLSGAISGQGALGADSGATVILVSNNTYSGTTTISSGTLQVGNAGTAGTLGSGDVVNNDKLVFDRSDSLAVTNNISGTGSLTKNNATGTLTLSGSNSYGGATAISGGILVINGINTGSGTVTVNSSSSVLRLAQTNAIVNGTLLGSSSLTNVGLLDLSVGGGHSISAYGTIGTGGFNMNFTNSSGSPATLTFTAATNYITLSSAGSGGRALTNLSANLTLKFNGALDIGSFVTGEATFAGAGNTVISGQIFNTNTGVRGVTKTGTGILTLEGANTYNGATTVSAGALRLANSSAMGLTNGLTNSVASGGALELLGGITVDGEILALNGRGVSDNGALRNISGNNTYNGPIELNATNRINSDAGTLTVSAFTNALSTSKQLIVGGAGNTVIAGALNGTGSGRLIKDGTGTLTISAANTVNGGITVGAGSIIVSSTGSINEADSSVIISNGANLRYDGTTSLRVASVSIEQGGGLDVGTSGSMRFVAGTNGVNTVSGAGTATFQGTFNIEISAAATNAGSSWPLVSVASPSYTGSFNVAGFTNSGGTWTCGSNGVTYHFSQSTGILSVASSTPVSAYNSWLTNYSTLSNTNGDADPDSDGFNNSMEFAFDGNPTVGTPALISAASFGTNTVFSFLASTNANAVTYVVQSTTDLSTVPWADNSSVTASITNSTNQANVPLAPSYVRREFTVPVTATNSFYRVKATIAQ